MASVGGRKVALPRIISTFAEYRHWRSTLPLKRVKLSQPRPSSAPSSRPGSAASNGLLSGTPEKQSAGTDTSSSSIATPTASSPTASSTSGSTAATDDDAVLVAPTIGFVPTMGALHAGHLALARRARKESDLVVLSIFVNPAQFAPSEDLDKYPRTLDRDLEAIAATAEPVTDGTNGTVLDDKTNGHSQDHSDESEYRSAVDVILLPSARELYPTGITQDVSAQRGAFIAVHGLSHQLEGLVRPHFFRGVSTVVHKLLAVVRPTTLYLGQKDVQQCVVVRRMMTDLLWHLDTRLVVGDTVREPDGLAMSSRNVYLSTKDRATAPRLYHALQVAKSAYLAGEARTADDVKAICRRLLSPSTAAGQVSRGLQECSLGSAELEGTTPAHESADVYAAQASRPAQNGPVEADAAVEEDLEVEYVSVADSVDLAEWIGELSSPPSSRVPGGRNGLANGGSQAAAAAATAAAGDGGIAKIAILSAAIRLGSTRILDNVLLDGDVADLGLHTAAPALDSVVGRLPSAQH